MPIFGRAFAVAMRIMVTHRGAVDQGAKDPSTAGTGVRLR